jgi:transcription initiation factor TFIID TATA-box-binding protein
VNVVSTADLGQFVDLPLLNKYKWGEYDQKKYRSGYIKDKIIEGKVSVFSTGKMISVGARNLEKSFNNLLHAKALLLSAKMISDVKLEPRIRNTVGVANLGHEVDLLKLGKHFPNIIYEPEQFPGGILYHKDSSIAILIFSSGKIVIAGAKTEKDLQEATKSLKVLESAIPS